MGDDIVEFFLKAFVAMFPFMYLFYLLGKACGRDEEKLKRINSEFPVKCQKYPEKDKSGSNY